MKKYDVLIVGGGSGGIAAAYAAAKTNPEKNIILIEAQPILGGLGTIGGVNGWEPGRVGDGAMHYKLYNALAAKGCAHVCEYKRYTKPPHLTAHVERDETAVYENTFKRANMKTMVYEPWQMAAEIENQLNSLHNLTVMTNTMLTGVKTCGDRIEGVSAYISDTGDAISLSANMFIDGTGNIALARMAGCSAEISAEPNGVTQIYVVRKKTERKVDDVPAWVHDTDAFEWLEKTDQSTVFNHYPCGMINGNTLPTVNGREYMSLGKEAKKTAVARTYVLWNFLQKEHGMSEHELSFMFPMLGVRESYRLSGRYTLSDEDVLAGHKKQKHRNSFIAIADHAIDIHKSNKGSTMIELSDYYGVPYECTLPKEFSNLAVACRGISATQAAAASCRLQRTIMQIGESIGKVAANSLKNEF